ncbi:MAG TPA: DUF58 domain-containing protein [Streptosporangiaceae bacterium]|nr:DUF58 domain-containing protein [Streptosporangiaceae bacterium]
MRGLSGQRSLPGALTTRGKCFLAAGCVAAVCGLGLGDADLFRAGILILALPLLSALAASRVRYRISCTRYLVPSRVAAGHPVEVRITVSNVSKSRIGLLLAQDATPHALGSRPRFVLSGIAPGGSREVSYQLRPPVRGMFTIGPLGIRTADAFGLVELGRSFASRSTLVVTPPVTPLPSVRAVGSRLGSGENGLRAVAVAGEDDIAPRAYRDGDDLRRVHWRSTARYGELMVRREEQQWLESTCLLLDTRRHAHSGTGMDSSFEAAVSAAASIAVHLAAQGTQVRLIADTGELAAAGPVSPPADGLLDMLAAIRTSRSADLEGGLAALRASAPGQVIAITGHLAAGQARQLAASRRGPGSGLALLMAVHGWGSAEQAGHDAGDAARILADAGWRVAIVTARTSLAAAWQQLHYQAGTSFQRAAAGRGAHGPADTPGTQAPGARAGAAGHAGAGGRAGSGEVNP